jgi:hypothetical protein
MVEVKVLNIGVINTQVEVEHMIRMQIKDGMKLEFMNDRFMVFMKSESKKVKNEKNEKII